SRTYSALAVIRGGGPGGGSGNCILSLASSGSGITLQGNPSINDPAGNCGVFSNSTDSPSISLGGSAFITAVAVGAACSVSVGGSRRDSAVHRYRQPLLCLSTCSSGGQHAYGHEYPERRYNQPAGASRHCDSRHPRHVDTWFQQHTH